MIACLFMPSFLMSMELPASLQVVLINKLIPFEKSLAANSNISVLVVAQQDVFQAFKLLKVKQKNSRFGVLEFAEKLPEKRYDIVYINDPKLMNQAKVYGLRHSSMLVSGIPSNAKSNVSLGLGTRYGKPNFFINKSLSDAMGVQWDNKIMNLAVVY